MSEGATLRFKASSLRFTSPRPAYSQVADAGFNSQSLADFAALATRPRHGRYLPKRSRYSVELENPLTIV
jgi:hypothetical protein